jgi:hypothetical protein
MRNPTMAKTPATHSSSAWRGADRKARTRFHQRTGSGFRKSEDRSAPVVPYAVHPKVQSVFAADGISPFATLNASSRSSVEPR